MLQRTARFLVPLLLAAAPGLAGGQPNPGGNQGPSGGASRWRIGAAFGYGERSNPLVQSDDLPIVVDLDIAWFGDRWFFDNGDAGFTFADNDALTASIVGRFNSDRVFFSRTNTRFIAVDTVGTPIEIPADFKPPDRDYAIELGVEFLTDGRWGALQLAGFHDASGTHDGFELNADYSFSWRRQRLHIEPSLGISYKSASLNDYYWGLTAAEGRGVVPAYEADAGINWNARLTIGYQLNRKWTASLVVEYERLNDEAFKSPIVEEQSVRGVFAGLARRF
ncbi:MAG TPA: MipA/OmpV family protein [Gammaproteobacteria bacterium]|nr:MipA/OmpV family protein [Gammaproteobacteria bacterium]